MNYFEPRPPSEGQLRDSRRPAARPRDAQPDVADGCARVATPEYAAKQATLHRAADHKDGHLPLRGRVETEEPIREPVRFGLPCPPILSRADRMTILITSVVWLRFFLPNEFASAGTVRLVTKPQPRTARTPTNVLSIPPKEQPNVLLRAPGTAQDSKVPAQAGRARTTAGHPAG